MIVGHRFLAVAALSIFLVVVLSVLSPTVVAAGITVRVAASSYVGFLKSLFHIIALTLTRLLLTHLTSPNAVNSLGIRTLILGGLPTLIISAPR